MAVFSCTYYAVQAAADGLSGSWELFVFFTTTAAAAMEMNPAATGWSRFELVVFRDKDVVEPLDRNRQLLAWRSYGNRTGSA